MAKRPRSFGFRLLRSLLIAYAGLCIFSYAMADRLIFMPQRPAYTPSAPDLVTIEDEAGERLKAFYFPPESGKPTVLYSHGNAEDIGNSTDLYQQWRYDGWGVLAYDYPGYGHSTGSPSESATELAIAAAWKFLTLTESIPANDIIIVGRSIGSGPSIWLAQNHHPRALILIAPFTSTFAVRSPAQYLLPGNRFPNLKRLRRIDTPLLVIHGERDTIIPASHGRTLHQASPATTKRFIGIPDTGHNDLGLADIITPMRSFVRELPGN